MQQHLSLSGTSACIMEDWASCTWGSSMSDRSVCLPPLVTETASSRLLSSLRHLDTYGQDLPVTPRPATSESSPGSLRLISRFGLRANERVAEADSEFSAHDAKVTARSGSAPTNASVSHHTGIVTKDITALKSAFESIVAGIDVALNGGDSSLPVKVVRRDEPVNETIPVNQSRHYRVALPARPTAVTVTAQCISGQLPTLWGSTSCEKPNSKNCSLKGRGDKLVYEHALAPAEDGDEASHVDRRHAVPSCRELFFTAEAEAGECSIRLLVTLNHMKVTLTRAEIAAQVRRTKRGWEARIHELQREPNQRETFEDRLSQIREQREARRRDVHGGKIPGCKEFVEQNAQSMEEHTPQARRFKIYKQALRGYARHEQVATRRELTEEQVARSRTEWLGRPAERRRQREEREELLLEQTRLADRQREWFTRLVTIAWAVRTAMQFKETKEMKEFIAKRMLCAGVIHQYLTRRLCQKRRVDLYRNVIALRVACTAYSRMTQIAVISAAQPVVRHTVEKSALNNESPTFLSIVKRFLRNVLYIQRTWKKLRMVRNAYVSQLTPYWIQLQEQWYCQKEKEIAEMERNLSKQAQEEQQKTLQELSAKDKKRGNHRSSAARDSLARCLTYMRTHAKAGQLPQEEGPLPSYVMKHILYEYVCDMLRSHAERLAIWGEQMQKLQYERDLSGFLAQDESHDKTVLARPHPVYIDMEELEGIVVATIEKWRAGGFHDMKANFSRLMRKVFCVWAHKDPREYLKSKSMKRTDTLGSLFNSL